MEERGHELALHALAERQVPHRAVDQVAELEELDQLAGRLPGLGCVDPEQRPVELEGLARRQVPQELLLLPHDEGDAPEEVGLARRGARAADLDDPRGGDEQAREHLERRGLAGPVRAEEADALAGGDLEGDPLDGLHGLVLAAHEGLERADQARGLLRRPVVLGERFDPDHARDLSPGDFAVAAGAAEVFAG